MNQTSCLLKEVASLDKSGTLQFLSSDIYKCVRKCKLLLSNLVKQKRYFQYRQLNKHVNKMMIIAILKNDSFHLILIIRSIVRVIC